MKMRLGDKANRILSFLLGLGDGGVAAVMQEHGMTQQDVDEGWNLLQGLGRRSLSGMITPQEANLRERLDEWENYWYPIAEAVLLRHFPLVHATVFMNLSQADVSQVVFSVSTLLERLDALQDPNGPAGADGPRALALLAKRRVDESVLSQARTLLAALRQFTPDETALRAEQAQLELDQAEQNAWSWYLEWSRISRVAIKSRRLLRKLGFLDNRGGATASDTLPDDELPLEPYDAPTPSARAGLSNTERELTEFPTPPIPFGLPGSPPVME